MTDLEKMTKAAFHQISYIIADKGNWLGRPVNIKEANKRANIYVARPLTLWHIICFRLIDNA